MSESETDLYPEEVDDTRRVELDEGETNPFKIREAVLELLEELEDSGNEGEEECHHLPWRGRCWRVRLVYVCVCVCTVPPLLTVSGVGRPHPHPLEGLPEEH